jgi:hypothetical protein
MDMVALFCDVDDCCRRFAPRWRQRRIAEGECHRWRGSKLCLREVMPIVIGFPHSGYRTFKDYFLRSIRTPLREAFPHLVSSNRFVELMQEALVPLCAYLQTRKGHSHGIAFIDSTLLAVCHPKRSARHKVFAGLAQGGRSSLGWGYGFKLHLLIDDTGELFACRLTAANLDDRVPVPPVLTAVRGKVVGDRGYISQALFAALSHPGIQLITTLRKDRRNKLMPLWDKLLLRKRSWIEPITEQLKHSCQIEHWRHRCVANFLVNLVAGLIAYTWQAKKPSLHIRMPEGEILPTLVL